MAAAISPTLTFWKTISQNRLFEIQTPSAAPVALAAKWGFHHARLAQKMTRKPWKRLLLVRAVTFI